MTPENNPPKLDISPIVLIVATFVFGVLLMYIGAKLPSYPYAISPIQILGIALVFASGATTISLVMCKKGVI